VLICGRRVAPIYTSRKVSFTERLPALVGGMFMLCAALEKPLYEFLDLY
jgi:hypothetical protein